MSPLKYAAIAAVAAAVAGCAAPRPENHELVSDVSDIVAEKPIPQSAALISDFDVMRIALPTFDLDRGGAGGASHGEISVTRDLRFPAGSNILPDEEVHRLVPLQNYLRAHPAVGVRVEAYGDDSRLSEDNSNLALARAQAVMRALTVDVMVNNPFITRGVAVPKGGERSGSAEITFIKPEDVLKQ